MACPGVQEKERMKKGGGWILQKHGEVSYTTGSKSEPIKEKA